MESEGASYAMNDIAEHGGSEIELNRQLPAELGGFAEEELRQLPMALRIWFDPRIMRTIERLAQAMARSDVAVPVHLRNKPFACASVIRSSMLWRLNPDGVAASTFETPGGTLGFMGRLCNAIIQASGHLKDGQVPRFEHVGDWKKVTRKFRLVESTKKFDEHGRPQKYPERLWNERDAEDLGIYVHIPLKDRDQTLRFPDGDPFWLNQAFPLFSTLWATDPRTQICYLVIRRAVNVALPGLMLGVPFDDDAYGQDMRDITDEATLVQTRPDQVAARPALASQLRRTGSPEPIPQTAPGRPRDATAAERAVVEAETEAAPAGAASAAQESGTEEQPRRRGRPPGSKNRPKEQAPAQPADAGGQHEDAAPVVGENPDDLDDFDDGDAGQVGPFYRVAALDGSDLGEHPPRQYVDLVATMLEEATTYEQVNDLYLRTDDTLKEIAAVEPGLRDQVAALRGDLRNRRAALYARNPKGE
jgi:hypothetical protein